MSVSLETLALAKKYTDEHGGGGSGTPGQAATIEVGETITGEPGTNASVENTGTSSAAVLKFTIPRGADGSGVPEVIPNNDGFVLTARSGQPIWEEPTCGILGAKTIFDDAIETVESDEGNVYINDNFDSSNIVSGSPYLITLNDKVFQCTAVNYQGVIAVGNLSIVFPEEPDTGEDFVIAVLDRALLVCTKEQGLYQLKIEVQILKQIDNKFIQCPILPGKSFGSEIFNYSTNNASGGYSHAEGVRTTASGEYSHAEGYQTTASGDVSHAEGNYAVASGEYSHAEGDVTVASGFCSHAEGNNTIAYGQNSHAQGKWNIADESNTYAHIVGNGSSKSVRSNAHTLSWEGDTWYAGKLYLGGTGQDDPNAWKANLPKYTSSDEGKILKIVNGVPAWVSLQSAEEVSF